MSLLPLLFVLASAQASPVTVLDAGGPDAVVQVSAHRLPLRDVLQQLASEAGVNLVLTDAVTGTVSVDLHPMTARQAFYALVELNQLCPTTASTPQLILLRPVARTEADGCDRCRRDQPWPG